MTFKIENNFNIDYKFLNYYFYRKSTQLYGEFVVKEKIY